MARSVRTMIHATTLKPVRRKPYTRGPLRQVIADDGEAGATVNEESDTWGFSWMPAIEEFVDLVASRAHDESVDRDGDWSNGERLPDGLGRRTPLRHIDQGGQDDGGSLPMMGAKRRLADGKDKDQGGKRKRPFDGGSSAGPPSYNETLSADKAFHNPHASETMADAFGIIRSFSFVLDVAADDRDWGVNTTKSESGPTASATGADAASGKDEDGARSVSNAGGRSSSRSWFYDTVRDRQNRLWADIRVKKGVELARKGEHQAAIDFYTQALGMCPDHEDGLVARGAGFATTGRLRQALQDLSRALSLNPLNENASNYLKETRRRMDHQGGEAIAMIRGLAPESSIPVDTSSKEGIGDRLELGQLNGDDAPIEGNEASKSTLVAMMQDGVEGDRRRKMRVLLEEDERKRKRERKSSSMGGGEDGRKKKSRKKEKKSRSSRSSRSSHHKRDKERDRRRASTGADLSETDTSSDSADDGPARSHKKRKRKKKHSRSKKKRSGARSMSSPSFGSRGTGASFAPTSHESSSSDDEESGEEAAHPILQRKKHSLWGM